MKHQSGFTLIELVIVIVILGILAITAAPKFLNMQDDARESTLKGVQAAVSSAAEMVHAKAVISGVETASAATITLGSGKTVRTVYGYPNGQDLMEVIDISASSDATSTTTDFIYASLDTAPNTIGIWPKGRYASASDHTVVCNVTYIDAVTSGAAPTILFFPGC